MSGTHAFTITGMEKRISLRPVSIDVHGELTAAILRNEIPPATRVNISAVAGALGVSATPVREALARLEADGLVTQQHLKGYSTTGLLTRTEIVDLWEFRLRIEPFSAARAAERITDEFAERLRAEIAEFAAAPSGSEFDSYSRFSAHDERLHHAVLEQAGNAVITGAFEHTHCHLHAFRLAYSTRAGAATVDEHAAVVDRILAGDATGAQAAMLQHLTNSRDRLLPLAAE